MECTIIFSFNPLFALLCASFLNYFGFALQAKKIDDIKVFLELGYKACGRKESDRFLNQNPGY